MLFEVSACRRFLTLFLCVLISFSACRTEDDDPVADEGVYINEIVSNGDDWIELYNKSTSTRDLSGYKIYDDADSKYALPSGTSIAANGFLVIFCDDLNSGLHTNFKLSSAGETVWLENSNGEIIDKVEFPITENDQSYGRFPDGSATFAISGKATQGTSNGGNVAPSISAVSRDPKVVRPGDDVSVSAELSATSGISAVTLYYRFNNAAFVSAPMNLSGTTYTGTIPAMNATGEVEYYVEAKSATGETSTHPASAPDKLHDYVLNDDALPQLVINEFMAFNVSCCPDISTGAPELDDWFEIYNAGSTAVNVAGYYVSDDPASPFKSKIPDTNSALTTIQPGQYLVIWADEQQEQGPLHAGFKLLQDGESIGLYYLDGRTVDETTFGVQASDVSVGRIPNGTGEFETLTEPSQGTENN